MFEESVSKTGGAGLGVKSGRRVILCRKGSQGCPETHAGPARAPAEEALPPFLSLPLAPPASHPLTWGSLSDSPSGLLFRDCRGADT